jgi:hypothetical protein
VSDLMMSLSVLAGLLLCIIGGGCIGGWLDTLFKEKK